MNDRRVLGSVYDDIEKLAVFPEMGVDILAKYGIISDYLCLITHKNCVFYRIDGEFIRVIRVLDENMNIADFNPLVRDAYLETVRRTIEVAKYFVALKNKYGKKEQPLILNMHMHHGIYITLPDKKVQMYERDFDVYMECILQFVKLCEEWIGEADIQIAIENTKKYLESLKESKRYEYNPNSFHRMYKQSFRIIL